MAAVLERIAAFFDGGKPKPAAPVAKEPASQGEAPMTPEEIALVQSSFKKIAPIADAAAELFYARLFEIAPDVRAMFPDDMTEQRRKLMQTLGVAVSNLHQVDKIVGVVQELGRKHVGYGVKPEQYDVVGQALLDTLEKGLGEEFTPDVKAAWAKTYGLVATTMKDAAAEAKAA